MTKLQLTAADTRPLICIYTASGSPVNITGYTFTLKIGYPEPQAFIAAILDAAAGKYQFPFLESDLIPGIFSAEVMITNPGGEEETTEKFQVIIEGRLI